MNIFKISSKIYQILRLPNQEYFQNESFENIANLAVSNYEYLKDECFEYITNFTVTKL